MNYASDDIEELVSSVVSFGVSRRRFLQMGAAAVPAAVFAAPLAAQADGYRVGVGRGPDAYQSTVAAIDASGEWPSVTGRVVVIKPNLVGKAGPETGMVTDPEVVRAVVDRALAEGAALVLIVETGPNGANFLETGFGIFSGYDSGNRVHLVDLKNISTVLASNPSGWIYKQVYTAALLRLPGIIFINVGKLKTHQECKATLVSKNLFGIPHVSSYISPSIPSGRFAMHDRGVNQAIVDLNLLRPTHFAIIDGIWGMEGLGPLQGTPVSMDTVLAGRNAVAVDRVGLHVMGLSQTSVRHLAYLSLLGFGPADLTEVEIAGDPLVTYPFALPPLPPEFDPPRLSSPTLDPAAGDVVQISTRFYQICSRKVEVVQVYDDRPDVDLIRTVQPFTFQNVGVDVTSWDGRDDGGTPVPPARYAVRVTVRDLQLEARPGAATSWVVVV